MRELVNKNLILGIDLGTSGVRIIIINIEKEVIYTNSLNYKTSFKEPYGWLSCLIELIQNIPVYIKKEIILCSIAGTSGTLIACDKSGEALGEAIPYYNSCSNQNKKINLICPEVIQNNHCSIKRGLQLIEDHGTDILLRHQADWINGWLMNCWEYGEECNNLKLGWNPLNKSWPKSLESHPLRKIFPKIVSSGQLIGKINPERANRLGLPDNLSFIAGTTDSNAAVIATDASPKEGICVLGSTIVLKKYVTNPIFARGITNHIIGGRWICGGASNAGGAVLKKFFLDEQIEELSNQINPNISSGLELLPLPSKGERFPIDDPNLEPILFPRPISDALYLQALLEGLAEIEKKGWLKLIELGVSKPKRIVTIGKGSKNSKWHAIRQKKLGIPIRRSSKPPCFGAAIIALNSLKKTKKN